MSSTASPIYSGPPPPLALRSPPAADTGWHRDGIDHLYQGIGYDFPESMLLLRSDLDSEYQTQQLNISSIPTISIVDDDESVRDALASLLKSVGYRTEVFASAEDFLHSRPHEETKCVILDIRMPGISGLELQRQLVAAGSRVRIIFVTAHADEEARAQAVSAGAVACLRKPFNEDVLLRAVESALQS